MQLFGKNTKGGIVDKQKREFHGLRNTPEYGIWNSMKQRCSNPKTVSYKRYGAVGIRVCERWEASFLAFHKDMGQRPSSLHSIERINNSLGYSPENCRWATPEEQANNTSSNFLLTIDGRTQSVATWDRETGTPSYIIRARIHNHGWSPKDAVFKPVGKLISYKGRSQTLARWCRELGLNYDRINQRIRKLHWPAEKAFETE
jgi:hypothetical protein